MLVATPASQPAIAATRMIQINDVLLEPTTQLIFTRRLFATTSATRITSVATSSAAHV